MKFKKLASLIEKMLGVDEEADRADMHLPVKLPAFGLALILAGLVLLVLFIVSGALPILIFAIIAVLIAPFTFLCYKFQRIYIISDDEFEYTTFWGKKTVYRFSDIYAIKLGSDSQTLLLRNGKVHIESMAIISDELKEKFNTELDRIYKKQDNGLETK